jgi:hypothetical protein
MEQSNTQNVLNELQLFDELQFDSFSTNETGYSSHVTILERKNKPFAVVKTPKIIQHGGPYREALVLAALNEAATADTAPFELPTLLNSSIDTPQYVAASYIDGTLLDFQSLAALSNPNKVYIGRQLAEAVHWTEQHLTAQSVPELDSVHYTPPHRMRYEDLQRYRGIIGLLLADDLDFYAHAVLDTLEDADECFDDAHLQGNAYGHNDLFGSNMVFDIGPDTIALKGIFDFGAAARRPTEFDFRFFNFISPYFTEGIVERYEELSGEVLNTKQMDIWSEIQVLGPTLYRASRGVDFIGSYKWQLEHFKQWSRHRISS